MNLAAELRARLDLLGHEIAERHFAAHPEQLARYGAIGHQRCREDARFHLQFLAAALEAKSDGMFLDYIGWAKVVLAARNVPAHDLHDNISIVIEVLAEQFGETDATALLRRAHDELPSMPVDVPTFLDPRDPHWGLATEYLGDLLRGNRHDATKRILDALDAGVSARDVYRRVFEPVQQEIGRLWQLNRISVAQEHFCTAATQHVMTQLYSRIFTGGKHDRRVVAMSVGGEQHEVGIRIITDLLELEGWQTWYLGANVPPLAAVAMCVEHRADVLLVSATLPPHIAAASEVIRLFHAEPALAHARVIVGGRAFRMEPGLWRTIGADGYAANADECIALITG
ncbi:MAG TPA: cobalamin-dependent protein [Thermoanaerobaculia bacterium]|jgi:methanogenic corrinoid protein MtbC1